MKKATNSKSRGKISKLFQITQEHFWKIYEPGAHQTGHQTDDVVARGSGQAADCELGQAGQCDATHR